MGFMLSKQLENEVVKIVGDESWNQEDARAIPGTSGMVLVKEDSKAFLERKGDRKNFKIPVRMKGSVNGVSKEVVFYVCTR